MLMLACLFACPADESPAKEHDSSPAEVDTAGDSTVVSAPDTGDSGPRADTAVDTGAGLPDGIDAACVAGLVAPTAFSTVEEVAAAAAVVGPVPLLPLLVATEQVRSDAQYDPDCPTFVEDADTGSYTVTGDCTSRFGSTFAGTLTVLRDGDDLVVTYEDFAYAGDGTFSADGEWRYVPDAGGAYAELALDFSIDTAGEHWPGTWTYGVTLEQVGERTTTAGRVALPAGSGAPAGDFCVAQELEDVAACGGADAATTVMVGATVARIEDPRDDCDACSPVTIDGVDVGESCG
jgi:hypothetical protein